jgi:hypothetical protein
LYISGVNMKDDVKDCHAKYGAIDKVVFDLQSYVNDHISRSFDYLLMVCILHYLCVFLYMKIYYAWVIF